MQIIKTNMIFFHTKLNIEPVKNVLGIFILLILILPSCNNTRKEKTISLIPRPVEMNTNKGRFIINSKTRILAGQDEMETAEYLQSFLEKHTGFTLNIDDIKDENSITLAIEENIPNKEGYHFKSAKSGIRITAPTQAGLFYGVQTLRQLLPPEIESDKPVKGVSWEVPNISITDWPEHEWRGFMLDCVRHYFHPSFIKELIDHLAARKMNSLHLHLTDDQGWRIEIKKYPKLIEKSAYRVTRDYTDWFKNPVFQKPGEIPDYGGYYTQDELREIVEYARKKHINIVPEIEMPSHTAAVFAAYPEFSCFEKAIPVPPAGRPFIKDLFSDRPEVKAPSDIPMRPLYCAGKEATFNFLEDVISEVLDIFPSEYIHIGGDEANKKIWEYCPDCQRRIRDNKLAGVNELEAYFIQRIQEYLNSNGRKLIGWDEIIHGTLDTTAAVMVWHGEDNYDIEAATQGFNVVMSPGTHCYFDAYQGPAELEPPAIGSYIPLSHVYSYNPVDPELNEEDRHNIMGGQANLWTEFVPNERHAEYKIFPRIEALAEILWSSPVNKKYSDFQNRLYKQLERYEFKGHNYAKSAMLVLPELTYDSDKEQVHVELTTELPMGEIFYTLDGSDPSENGIKYTGHIYPENRCMIKAVQIKNSKPVAKINSSTICLSKAIGAKTTFNRRWHWQTPYTAPSFITNGVLASEDISNWQWIQFSASQVLEITLDLNKVTKIQSIETGFLHSPSNYVISPEELVYLISNDGEDFHEIKRINAPQETNKSSEIFRFMANINESARYLKIITQGTMDEPENPTYDNWFLIDEVIVK